MLKLISSMAMRQVLSELAAAWQKTSDVEVSIESVGGVDAAKRVQAGETFDGVVLASDAIDILAAGGAVVAGSRVDLVLSSVAIAVKAGAPLPDTSTESALRSAIGAARTIGYSTGPSGTALVRLFERWGIAEAIKAKIVQAPPGVPVGTLVACGEVALGFQQLSELMHMEGITVVGTMPEAVAINTVFSAATCAASTQRETLARLYAFMTSTEADAVKQKHGMQPVLT